jgi:hypothetical protein
MTRGLNFARDVPALVRAIQRSCDRGPPPAVGSSHSRVAFPRGAPRRPYIIPRLRNHAIASSTAVSIDPRR